MKKKRSIYLALISAATVAAICFGTWKHVSPGHLSLTMTGDSFYFTYVPPNQTTIRRNLDAFDSIDLNLSKADIELQSGSGYSMVYRGVKEECPSLSVKDGVLTATEPESKDSRSSDASLVLTVPKDLSKFKEISLSSGNGDITIDTGRTLNVDSLTLNSSNGDLELDRCTGKSLAASSSNGDINMEGITFATSTLETANGDIEVNLADNIRNYTISAYTNSGETSIGDSDYDAGSISVGSGSQKMSAQTDNGDIEIEND